MQRQQTQQRSLLRQQRAAVKGAAVIGARTFSQVS